MLLKAEDLGRDYRVGKEVIHALRGVDLEVPEGDFLIVNGPSGSGKTTLLNLIGCIDRPTQGEVYLEGRPTSKLSEGELAELRKEKIGLIFQTFNLIPVLSAYENIEYPLLLLRLPRRERRRRVLQLLEEVELIKEARRRPDELSGGQKQRVAIARALVTEPKLVLADEPTGNLDSETSRRIMAMMERLNETYQVSFIVATHDPLVGEYAKRTASIRDGRLQLEEAEDA